MVKWSVNGRSRKVYVFTEYCEYRWKNRVRGEAYATWERKHVWIALPSAYWDHTSPLWSADFNW